MFGRKKNYQTRRGKHFLMLLLPKRPINALARPPTSSFIVNAEEKAPWPRRKPHG
jgi:hypothetical protein